jgi:hypothetical protein
MRALRSGTPAKKKNAGVTFSEKHLALSLYNEEG